MKKAYDYFSKIGGMYVFLGVIIVNEENDEQGIFHGQLIYTSKEGVISFRQFNSMENVDDVISKADLWIKENGFPDLKRGPVRETGSIPV